MEISATTQRDRAGQHYVDFRNSRLYFGIRFWIAVTIVAVSIAVSVFADSTQPLGRVVLAGVAFAGVIVGLLLQPVPKPIDHQPRARQALQNLSTSLDLVSDVTLVATQLAESATDTRTQVGLVNIAQDLGRTKRQILYSMAEWDALAPGAVGEFQRTRQRGAEMFYEIVRAQEEQK